MLYEGNLTDLGKDLANLYEKMTQIEMSCAVAGIDAPYSEEEEQILPQDGLAVQFASNGKFERIGYFGNWHKVRSFTAGDLAKVFSKYELENFGVISEPVQNTHNEWVAQLTI